MESPSDTSLLAKPTTPIESSPQIHAPPLLPQQTRPTDSPKTRPISPKPPSTASRASPLLPPAPIPRSDSLTPTPHPSLLPVLNGAHPAQPDQPAQPEATSADRVKSPDLSKGPDNVSTGREGIPSQPQESLARPKPALGLAQPPGIGQDEVSGRQNETDSGAMDLDETHGRQGENSRLISLKPVPLDVARPQDILSSPGSTAQTVATPAVQDASPDTSPDNEGPPYSGDEEEARLSKENKNDSQQLEEQEELAESSSGLGAPHSAAAQLLLESANAERPVESSAQTPVHAPPASNIPVQSPTQKAVPSLTPTVDALPTPSDVKQSEKGHDLHRKTPSPAGQASMEPSVITNGETTASADTQMALEPSATASISTLANDNSTQIQTEEEPPRQETTKSTSLENAGLSDEKARALQDEADLNGAVVRKRRLLEKSTLKHRSAPMVLFEKPAKRPDESIITSSSQGRPPRIPTDDYFVPLFFDGFTRQSSWMKGPEQLLANTHKTLSSPDCSIVLREKQACNVLRRIYHLQQHDKWSLRQPKRWPEPIRPPSHWDTLLQEMKWMRTDFREERKWKRAVARNLADACVAWVAATAEERKALQVKAKLPPLDVASSFSKTEAPTAEAESSTTPMPDLVPSEDADSPMDVDDEPQDWNDQTVAPSNIFALQDDDVVFGLRKTEASDRLLDELPLYGVPLKAPQPDLTIPEYDPDARWRRPALPLSKYVDGKMVLKPEGLQLVPSRYDYVAEDEDDDFEVAGAHSRDARSKLAPENTDVALFRPEMKMIRDRLHAGHQFRPPTESLMPGQNFYENRLASMWTLAEDDELRRLVREYAYNWTLISQMISPKTVFVSAEERRTPWECFERWVQLEGYPNDTARTQYFQTYQRRIDSAQRAIAQANENAKSSAGPNGAAAPVQRRRTTLPFRVERKPAKRPFAIIEAMKKQAKKREAAITKQQQTANNQSKRAANENPPPKLPTKTPEDYSRLRHERDKQMHEKILRFQQQQQQQHEAQRQVSIIIL